MIDVIIKKTELFPKRHMVAVAACSFLVFCVALWPGQSQSVVVELTPQIDVIDSTDAAPIEIADTTIVRETVESGDTLSAVFERSGAGVTILYKILANAHIKQPIERIYPGQEFEFHFNSSDQLELISFNESPLVSHQISIHGDSDATIDRIERTPDIHTRYASATITDSLYLAGANAGLTDNMTMQLATIFGWDIDFALDIRLGDSFSLLYEEHYLDGEKLNDGPILAAKFINNGREVIAVRYTDESGRTDYFAPNGDSMRKAFLRTPLDIFRVSSRFNPNRMHPVLNRIVAHRGTDYAAPTGTPIKASGDGKVLKAYYSNTYGNVVVIQHGESIRTLYAHMSRFSNAARVGNRVKQGQVIGYVGTTGRSTGPHLHYEFQVNGVHKNPQTVQLPNAQPLERAYLEDFDAFASNLLGQLTVYDEAYAQGLPVTVD